MAIAELKTTELRAEENIFNRLLLKLKPGNREISLVLALGVLISVAWPLQKAGWGEGLPPLILLSFMGAGLGLIFASKRIPAIISHFFALVLGTLFVFLLALIITPGEGFSGRLENFIKEIAVWIYALNSSEIQGGNLEFIILLLSLFWAMGYSTAWQVLRHHQWWSTILPAGLVLLLTLYNLPEELHLYFPIYLVLSFLLIAHVKIGRRQKEWEKSHIPLSTPLRLFHLIFLLVFIMVGIVIAWNFPALKVTSISNQVIKSTRGIWNQIEYEFGRLFASLPARKPIPSLKWVDTHFFSGPPSLSETTLFLVGGREPHYWRARVYDKYSSRGWFSSPIFLQGFDEETLRPPEGWMSQRVEVRHFIQLNAVTETLFPSGIPIKSSIPAQLAGRENYPWDVLEVRSMVPLHINQRYEIVSSISVATPEQLRGAGNKYPRWIADNYIQLPKTLPDRVRNLSKDITLSARTPYDKAMAIMDYLKKTYPYSLDVPAPPRGTDGVDYFLFSQKSGYCDYFASAMAVMLRSIDIPARLVIGFATGEWDDGEKNYIVRELNYHSWPEVYFPGYGWVEFEPTPPDAIEFRNTLRAIAGTGTGADEDEDEFLGGEISSDSENRFAFLGSIKAYFVFFVFLFLSLFAVAYYFWWGRLQNLGYPAVVYAKLCRLSGLVGRGPRPQQTPLEYAKTLSQSMPSHSASINRIVNAYIRTKYSDRRFLPFGEPERVDKAWTSLRTGLIKRLFGIK